MNTIDTIDTIECIICLNNIDISVNEQFTLTCCKNYVHIYCLGDWVNKNITNKNINRCFICSQENSMLESLVLYNMSKRNNNTTIIDNSYEILITNDNTNNIINHNNNINDIILANNTNMLDISYAIDKRLYYLIISIKLFFLIFLSTLLMLLLYIIT